MLVLTGTARSHYVGGAIQTSKLIITGLHFALKRIHFSDFCFLQFRCDDAGGILRSGSPSRNHLELLFTGLTKPPCVRWRAGESVLNRSAGAFGSLIWLHCHRRTRETSGGTEPRWRSCHAALGKGETGHVVVAGAQMLAATPLSFPDSGHI